MNKRLLHIFTILSVFVFVWACKKEATHDHEEGHQHDDHAPASNDQWKEMDEFHMVMAESFHPYKDSANLEPAKLKAEEMAQLAEKWAEAPLPEKVNRDEVRDKLQQLKSGTSAFTATVKSGDDKVIGERLDELHNLFHELQESWYDADGHGHH